MKLRYARLLSIAMAMVTPGAAAAIPAAAPRPSVVMRPGAGVALKNASAQTLSVSLKCPRFIFDNGPTVGDAAPTLFRGDIAHGKRVEASFRPIPLAKAGNLEVKSVIQWLSRASLLRKWAMFRIVNTATPLVLKEVVLEDMQLGGRAVVVAPYQVQSQPAFLDGFFAGIEFPIAATRAEAGHLLIAHRPGLRMQPGRWYRTRTAIFGAAERGEEKRAFRQYLRAHRPGPAGLHVNYNSWWTSPVPYTERDILSLINVFRRQLVARQTRFDTFCVDMGWSNPRSIWEIETKLFPDGFAKLRHALGAMGCRLGLWVSPSSCYPPALDNEWAQGLGYETFAVQRGGQPQRFACLAGRRYRSRLQERLVDVVKRYRIRHIKLDGYLFECPAAHHGHELGPLSAEAVAEGIISVAEAVRHAAPDVWFEPTCFGWNPSPWWLFHFNSVIGCYGDDAPWGRVPCPVYRESYTTARDFFNLQGAYWNPAPIAAEEVLGIVHQTPEPFLNDAVMTVMRGHMFLPLYLNPAYMDGARWRDLSALLAWARKHASALEDTDPLLPAAWSRGDCPRFTADAAMPRAPYGYAHWRSDQALIAIRNPWIMPATYLLRLNPRSASLSKRARLSVVSIYPEERVYASHARWGDTVRVPLAPYETVVLAVAWRQAVRGIPPVSEALRPRISAAINHRELTKVGFAGPPGPFGPDWTSLVGDAAGGVRLQLQATATITAPRAELLVLLEDTSPPTGCFRLCVDGKDVAVSTSDSGTGWAACGQPKPEHWLFFRAPIGRGQRNLNLEVLTPNASPEVSVWVWATKTPAPRAAAARGLPGPEVVSLDARPLLAPSETRALAPPTIIVPRPAQRINGIYLDAVEPVSVSQGWGTLQRNRSVGGQPMTIAGRRYSRGLGTHAPSRIAYALDGRYRRFQCRVGADGATSPTVAFEVWTDGRKRWHSGLMRREDPAKWVDIDIRGARRLELVVTDAANGIGADHADWADAKLVR